tara:strand:- start:5034 stop:5543 length:510 start_codon:yes stop_codon:yes gene_type:complete
MPDNDTIVPNLVTAYFENDIEIDSDIEQSTEESDKSIDYDFIITITSCGGMLILLYYTCYVYMHLYMYFQLNDIDSISIYVITCSTLLNFMYYIFLKGYFQLETNSERIKINILNISTHCLYSIGGYYILDTYYKDNDLYVISKRYYYSHYVMMFLIAIRSIYLKYQKK